MNQFKNSPTDSLFEQMTAITKAHGYNILADEVKKLQAENSTLKQTIRMLEAAALEPTGAYTD